MDELPKPGDRIVHTIFGAGTVQKVETRWAHGPSLLIQFDQFGPKELLWSFCRGKLSAEPIPLKGD